MLSIEQILNLAKESGIGIKENSSHSGCFYEDLNGDIHEISLPLFDANASVV